MKNISPAALAILSAGSYILYELYDFTLTSGQVYRFTNAEVPLSAAVYPSGSANSYGTGLIIERDALTQKAGLDAGSMKLVISPQPDSPSAPVLINGYPLLQACRYGFLDAANIRFSVLAMNLPAYTGGQLDTSPGAFAYFVGTAMEIDPGRQSVEITVNDFMAHMSNQQMPRNIYSAGCGHKVYDAGCGLLKANFTVTGSISSATDGAHFNTGLTQADHYFELGVITFTSGVNNGYSQTVGSFLHASGAIITKFPFPKTPGIGDTFSIYPGCDLQQATCSGTFNNLAHFSGAPYVPVPETMLDGGTDNPPLQTQGNQAGQIIGSATGGRYVYSPYKT